MSERSHSRTPPRPARGIRGGKAARRKREAYLRYQEAQGFDRRSVGVVHAGATVSFAGLAAASASLGAGC